MNWAVAGGRGSPFDDRPSAPTVPIPVGDFPENPANIESGLNWPPLRDEVERAMRGPDFLLFIALFSVAFAGKICICTRRVP